MHKISYYIAVLIVSILLVTVYATFFMPRFNTENNSALTLTPFTQHEQRELIQAQEQEAANINAGPLTARIKTVEAEDKILNLPQINPVSAK